MLSSYTLFNIGSSYILSISFLVSSSISESSSYSSSYSLQTQNEKKIEKPFTPHPINNKKLINFDSDIALSNSYLKHSWEGMPIDTS